MRIRAVALMDPAGAAPDSLAGLCDMIHRAALKARVIDRPF